MTSNIAAILYIEGPFLGALHHQLMMSPGKTWMQKVACIDRYLPCLKKLEVRFDYSMCALGCHEIGELAAEIVGARLGPTCVTVDFLVDNNRRGEIMQAFCTGQDHYATPDWSPLWETTRAMLGSEPSL